MDIKNSLNIIDILIRPNPQGKNCNFEDVLKNKVEEVLKLHSFELSSLDHVEKECKTEVNEASDTRWKYVCIGLELLLILKEHLKRDENELLSVSQQKSIKILFEFIISLGLLPYLLPGVGLPIDQRCSNASLSISSTANIVPDLEKYHRICIVTRVLISLTEETSISSILLSRFLSDVLAALCQLTLPKFKEPTDELIADQEYFKAKLKYLISTFYQPLVINALMCLQGNKKSPKWLRLGVSKMLTERLMEKHGVLSTVTAILDSANTDDPTFIIKLESIAKLIVMPHIVDVDYYYSVISPQIKQLISSDDVNLMRIGVLCCRIFYEKDRNNCNKYIISNFIAPFQKNDTNYSEQEITECIQNLHKCFAIPSSDLWSVNIEPIVQISKVIYKLYCTICDSVSNIKNPVEDLLWAILSKPDNDVVCKIIKSILLDEMYKEIKEFPEEMTFEFGDEGGVKIKFTSENKTNIEYSKCILKLLEEKDINGKITINLFIILLNYSIELNGKEITEIKLYVTELLADLAEMETIQKTISKNPQPVIDFIDSLIMNKLHSCNNDTEIVCIALMLLISVINDIQSPTNIHWDKLIKLSVSLPKLSTFTQSSELKMLCDEVYNIIITRGTASDKDKLRNDNSERNKSFNSNQKKVYNCKSTSKCDEALKEACDPLLPVRGHAMLELTKLIINGDKETVAKKNAILCIFQENLKHEDTFLYLSAIEGLSSLAVEFPDTVLVTLTEEYHKTETTVRLKVGEALMRVVRRLGDMIPVYKTELLNSFLSGVRDTDNLVRASSLSNVGELCQLLTFRIGTIAAEILNCVECVIKTDSAPEPRRAAVMLLTLLLRGLELDTLHVLEPFILPLYRTLKTIYENDKDDVVKLHAQLAIEEINKSTLAYLFPRENLSKRIFILDSPPQ